MKKVLLIMLAGLILSIGVFAADTIHLGYVNWAEGIAMTHLAEAILEEKMGYNVETIMADVGVIYASLTQGDLDAFMDGWLPITHGSYMERLGDELLDLGYNYTGARIGLVVPSYVPINSIDELNEHKDKFNGRIVGIDPGAGIMQATERAIDEYNLDLTLMESSGPVMAASLGNAIDRENWIVVTGWTPHWKFARWDLKFLEDPKGVYGASENIHTIARRDFVVDYPDVAEFLIRFRMNDQQLGDLMGKISDSNDEPLKVATQWMYEHEDIVENWIPNK